MKILHVIPNLFKGGAQRLVIDICNEFKNRSKIEVKIIVLSNSKNYFAYASKNLEIQYCDINIELSVFKKNNINIGCYERLLDDFKPEVIHSHLYLAELVTHEYPRKNIRYVTHFHNNLDQLSRLKFKNLFFKKHITNLYEKKRLLQRYKKTSKTFITISNDCQKYLKSVFPSHLINKTVKLENAINHSLFSSKEVISPKKKINLINVGNLFKNKNQIFLVDVVKYLLSKNHEATLTLIGDGICREEITDKVISLGLEEHIEIIGSVDNVQDYLWKSNCYVHSAYSEAFGLVLLESMAARIPIVSYNGRGNSDIIINKETGILIEQLDEKIFGDAIINLFSDHLFYKNLAEKAYAFSKKYDIKKYVSELIKIYKI